MKSQAYSVVLLFVCFLQPALGQTKPVTMRFDGRTLELTPPKAPPTLIDVLDAYNVEVNEPESVGILVEKILQVYEGTVGQFTALEVVCDGADSCDELLADPEAVEVYGLLSDGEADVSLHVAGGKLHVNVTHYVAGGEATSLRLQCAILEPIAIVEEGRDKRPLQPAYIATVGVEICTCDDNKGVKGCTEDKCDAADTCPEGPNGVSCAWIALEISISTQDEEDTGLSAAHPIDGLRPVSPQLQTTDEIEEVRGRQR